MTADDGEAARPSDRGFRLITTWRIPAPANQVWRVLADPGFTWPSWWPGLTMQHAGAITGPDGLGAAGSWVRLRVRSPVGGALSMRLDLIESHAPGAERSGQAKLRVSGDLRGGASVAVRSLPGDRSSVRLVWFVTPVRGLPAALARISPGLCRWSHAAVLRSGERGLTRHLRKR